MLGCGNQAGGRIDPPEGVEVVETDSTLLVQAEEYRGVVFTQTSPVPFTYVGDSLVTVKTLKLLMWNDSVRFRQATVGDVAAFERDFRSYWEEARTESLAVANGKAYLPFTRTDFLGRQYIGYVDTTRRPHLFVNFFPLDQDRVVGGD